MINTPATTKEIRKVQLVKAHLEKNKTNPKKLIFYVKASVRKYLASGAPEGASISLTKILSNQNTDAESQKLVKQSIHKDQVSSNQN